MSADLYSKPSDEFELIGKTLLDAQFAPIEKLVPMLMQAARFLGCAK